MVAPDHGNRERQPGSGESAGDMPPKRWVRINLNEGTGLLGYPERVPGFQTGKPFNEFGIHRLRICEGRVSFKHGMWQLRVRPRHSGVTFCVGIPRGAYFLSPGGEAGTAAVRWHFPLPVLPPVSRPLASW